MALQDVSPLTRSWSFEILPPDMSELRVALLGNCWRLRCFVESLLVRIEMLNRRELEWTTRVSSQLGNKKITVVNTPDLLHIHFTEEELKEKIKEFADASEPGPHVLLLVLQPEDFTSQQQERLQKVLEMFSEHSFDHSMVLISTDREERVTENMPLRKMIRKCRYRYMWLKNFTEEETELKNFKLAELLSRLGQIVKDNKGYYLIYETFEDPSAVLHTSVQDAKGGIFDQVQKHGLTAQGPTKSKVSETSHAPTNLDLRILLLGKSDDKKRVLSQFITRAKTYRFGSPPKVECGEWRGKRLTVVKTSDLFSMSVEKQRDELKKCVSECPPGPNVLLLLVKPSEFTEDDRETLKFILTMLAPNAFKHSILIFTHFEQMTVTTNLLIHDFEARFYSMQQQQQNLDDLMKLIGTMVETNQGSFVTINEGFTEEMKRSLNIILCGRKGAGKTSVADVILGGRTSPEDTSPECIKRQRDLPGLLLSIVEMPSLCSKPYQTAMEQSFNSISLCDPDGVHAFVLVLPLNPLTDEDKAEFKLLQDILGSHLNAFTIVLFIVESDPSAKAFTDFVDQNKDLKQLYQSCGGRYLIFNIKDQHQVSQILDKVLTLTTGRNVPTSYTKQMFVQTQIEKIASLQSNPASTETSLLSGGTQRAESLRIVLIGKTGSGKSTSGNTILGRQEFKWDLCQTSVTKLCQKAKGEVDGRRVEVVDTPGLFDSTMTNYEVNEEMLKCISLLAPGPHIFLLVLQIGRFTPEEKETLNLIKKGFGKDAERFTLVLFTRGDDLERAGLSLEEYIELKCDDSCKKLISDCGNRCHIFDNNNTERQCIQVSDLIKKIDDVVRANGGGCYTSEMLQEAEAAIQKETQRLLKEQEQELRSVMKEMEAKYKMEMQEIKLKMEEQSKEIERERQERDKELEADIKKERTLRINEQNQREEEGRQREAQDRARRQEYEQKLQELEVKIKMESKENFDKKLQESRDKMERDQEAWEEERRQWWSDRYKQDEIRRQEEHSRLEKLEQEYKDKLEIYRIKKEEEDENRREQEEKQRKELHERHKKQVEDLRRTYEEEARKKAEEFNDFKRKKEIDFAAKIDKHLQEVTCLKEKLIQGQEEYERFQTLSSHKETTLKSELEDQHKTHKSQMIDLAIQVLKEKKENSNKIRELQRDHEQKLIKCKKDIEEKFKQKEKEENKKLKMKNVEEVKDLERDSKKEDLQQRKKEQSAKHDEQLKQLKSNLCREQKQELEEEMKKLEQKHVQEMNTFTQTLLKKHEEEQNKRVEELEQKHKQEMEVLIKKAGESAEKVEQLRLKHQQEINDIKKKMLPEEGLCSIL